MRLTLLLDINIVFPLVYRLLQESSINEEDDEVSRADA